LPELHPIGIFDSGIGGLTIFDAITKKLPQYDYIYFGDNARTPYGTRSFEVVYAYTLQAVKRLFDMGCHLVILACNTASAKALRNIQQKDLFGIDPERRVLGVIRPSIEVISDITKTRHVGILGTEGTVSSESYPIEIKKLFPDIVTVQEACPMWVQLVESNEIENPGTDYFVKKNIQSLLAKDPEIDTIVLGCTHYPMLNNTIRKFVPSHIKIISQGEIVAEKLEDYLRRHPEMDEKCTKNGIIKFYTSESPVLFKKKSKLFLKREVEVEHLEL